MTTQARILGYGSAGLLVLAGVAAAVSFDGTLGQVLALVLIALGFVLATSLVFFEVGLSEDRERERERAARKPPARQPRSRLQRMRGRPRRLR